MSSPSPIPASAQILPKLNRKVSFNRPTNQVVAVVDIEGRNAGLGKANCTADHKDDCSTAVATAGDRTRNSRVFEVFFQRHELAFQQ